MAKNRILFSNDFVLKNEKVGVNTTDPQALLDVNGELRVTGVSTFTNDVNISGVLGVGTVIDIIAYDTLSNGTLSFEGSAGQLFSISNNLTSGSVFSVNDVSIDVDADGTIQLAPFGANEYVGIGTTNPTQKLDVNGNIRLRGALYDNSNGIGNTNQVLTSTGAGISWQDALSVTNDTLTNSTYYPVFVDTTSGNPTQTSVSSSKLNFNPSSGNFSATQFTSLSDRTNKTNIRPIENALEITKQLEGVRFDWIDNDKPSVGLIAQDVEKILPELVETSDNGTKSVSYGNIIGVLIEAIKEQQKIIDKIMENQK